MRKSIIIIFGFLIAIYLFPKSNLSKSDTHLEQLTKLNTANAEEWWYEIYDKIYYYQPWDDSWVVDCYFGGSDAC